MTAEKKWWKCVQFDFVKVPKDLFRVPQYEKLSALAKLLYGFLLDRTSLSGTNGEAWTDDDGENFIYYPITEVMERFQCGHDKAAALLQELERAGLITRTLKGRGRPYRIVVKPFSMTTEKKKPKRKKKQTADLENPDGNKTENKTDMNYTDLITPFDRVSVEIEIKENISYEVLLEQVPQKLLDGIVDVIVDTICTQSPTVKISGDTIPREEVRRRFRELDQMDIYYVNDSLKKESNEIRYLRGYILSRLYEAKNLSDVYYEKWVEQDLKKTWP